MTERLPQAARGSCPACSKYVLESLLQSPCGASRASLSHAYVQPPVMSVSYYD